MVDSSTLCILCLSLSLSVTIKGTPVYSSLSDKFSELRNSPHRVYSTCLLTTPQFANSYWDCTILCLLYVEACYLSHYGSRIRGKRVRQTAIAKRRRKNWNAPHGYRYSVVGNEIRNERG
ncbi:uncharacterized protein BO87DRAFT_63958 [Aspergillus neoniger CBS 115656]|uniref:Secreted protein n=1 Tax=Aspergillus neoniger (strain CBS 115656) TaxID=1448310 RepID=A0A318YHX8_ASPNB|nr:hypothetical protein BO87DRAFT_63958 [Aspergillus neoniger CBS 115656]PYH34131.1 hypothetical protein BO87DRAFT_63958 [Aspergillus neoniger CBS 115656]